MAKFFRQDNYNPHLVVEVVKGLYRAHQHRLFANRLKLFRDFSAGSQSFAAGNYNYAEMLFRTHGLYFANILILFMFLVVLMRSNE
ncbi:hypothetical protein SDC9_108050 [bioreactor metagenome]|uniref:Uncharacterized protein n=1 Tax=bioreactor metagenome TaxID=1076179 RepID=A0A645BHH4_9ZZZZ